MIDRLGNIPPNQYTVYIYQRSILQLIKSYCIIHKFSKMENKQILRARGTYKYMSGGKVNFKLK